MYGFCRNLQPPTGIEHCISGYFTSVIDINLIISRANILEIYTLCRHGNDTNLILSKQISLSGNVESLSRLRLPGFNLDTLLVTFADAKIIQYSFDSVSNSFISIYSNQFDDKEKKRYKINTTPQFQHPTVKIDPLCRCVAMVYAGNKLIIFPINKKDSDSVQVQTQTPPSHIFGKPWAIDLTSIGIIYPVIDFDFLYGYNEPTLVFLYHSKLTWEGRFAVCKDNVMLSSLSLNVQESQYLFISVLDSLPHDLIKIQVLPTPLCGLLLVGSNQIMRVTHIVDACLSFNEFGDKYSNRYPFTRSNTTMMLKSPQVGILPYSSSQTIHLIISTQDSDLYILTIIEKGIHDSKLHFQCIGKSVLCTCICPLLNEYVFIGSRLGDSNLINLKMNKNKNINEKESNQNQLYSFNWSVKDTLYCLGPVSDMFLQEYSDSISSLTETNTGDMFISSEQKPLDIITTIGHTNEGALCLIHGGIRPNILSSFPLNLQPSGCWSVYGQDISVNSAVNTRTDGSKKIKIKKTNTKQLEEKVLIKKYHQYFFISNKTTSSTLVYSLFEDGLYQVETNDSEFVFRHMSIAVGNILNNTRIVQVYTEGIRLLYGTKNMQDIFHKKDENEQNERIFSCSISDPYILVLTTKGNVLFYVAFENDKLLHNFSLDIPDCDKAGSVTSICLYKITESDTICCMSRASGRLEFYRIERSINENGKDIYELNRFFWSPNFALGFQIAENAKKIKSKNQNSDKIKSKNQNSDKVSFSPENPHADIYITDLCFFELEHKRYFLAAYISTDDLYLYEIFIHSKSPTEVENENLRLSKIAHTAFTRDIDKTTNLSSDEDSKSTVEEFFSTIKQQRLCSFKDIGNKKGIFIRGNTKSYWLLSTRSYPRIFPFSVKNPVVCFTPSTNSNCHNGYNYLDNTGYLRMSQLSSKMNYDGNLPFYKIPIGLTVEYIAVHSTTKVLAVSTSRPVQIDSLEEVTDRSLPIYEQKYELRVYSPYTLQMDNIYDKFSEHETIMVLKSVTLLMKQADNSERKQVFLAVATATLENEEIGCKGQVILFDVYQANIVSVEGTQISEQETIQVYKIQHIYTHKEKGPVSALSTIKGMLVVAVGPKIILYRWDGTDLVATSFYDSELMTSTIDSFRNYMICGDLFKSIYLLIWEPITKQLCLIGKDTKMLGIYTTRFLMFNDDVGFLTSDGSKNIMLLTCIPEHHDSSKTLNRLADYHLGSNLSSVTILRTCYPFESNTPNTLDKSQTQNNPKSNIQTFAFGGTHDGSFITFLPIHPRIYTRLNLLMGLLLKLPKFALPDLNPDFRHFKPSDYSLLQSKGNILDGELLSEYISLDIPTQRRIARLAGGSPNLFINYILHTDKSASFL